MAYGVDDAIVLGSLAASAAGTGASIAGQEEAASAQRKQAHAEYRRQQEYQKKAQERVNQSIASSTRDKADESISNAAEQRMQRYQQVGGISAPTQVSTGNTTVMANPRASGTAASNARAASLAAAWNRIVAPSQARLGATSDWGLQQNIKDTRVGEDLAVIGDAARGSSRVNQAEIADAAHSGDTLAGIGSILGALGSVGGMYAATKPTTNSSMWNRIIRRNPMANTPTNMGYVSTLA